ncbi:MAG: efflux RND transporter permease subunit [Bacteroides sp.]|nr:efflux RND transporter permease subunit [Bacteroides sp.]MCM1413377.1 efflux RND transporter permease subunit [Bacteroides sp.]MCM1471937.1 efflux RND transporter permease subunit [Bacteroides sp.]
MFSRFFIDRPIFATVLAILMILAGLLTIKTLPVAQFPDITPPTVFVSASYPGADASTVAEVIGVPIEEQVNGVEGMMYMSSTSSDGSYSLSITFENGIDLDNATVKVQNLVSQATPQLPNSVQEQGINVSSHSSDNILFIAIEGDSAYHYDGLYLTNYAQLSIVDELARVDGVGSVNAFGAGSYSMRIWLNPEKMQARGITPSDVVSVISSQNMEVSAGNVGAPPVEGDEEFQYTLTAKGRLTDAEQFGEIIVRADNDGGLLRLKDIATVELGSESYTAVARVDGHEAGLLGIAQLPGANALTVAKKCEARLAELAEYFPPGVHYRIIEDSTEFVTASIDEVLVTFVETTLIVMIVILLFLQSWRAVVIPMITIPVSLIATFAVMKLMGFTINTLTLFGLVLAIAIVVDDAIVVVEDCARLVQEGKLSPRQSAVKAMEELQGPVIGEVLVLLSVFIPTAFVSGITGELYKQFALTIAVSTAFSGFNALTFTPAMCALFLRKREPSKFFLYTWFNKGFGAILKMYMKIVGDFLRKPLVAIGVYLAICFVAFYGFIKWPSTYIPSEDMGYFMTSIQLPTGASLDRTDKILTEVRERIDTIPEIANIMSISGVSFMGGGSTSNVGSLIVVLKPWSDRKSKSEHIDAVIAKVTELTSDIQEAEIFSLNPPSIPGLGLTSGLQMQLLDINNLGAAELQSAVDQIREAAAKDPRLASVTSMYQGEVPQYQITVNRDKAKMQGVTIADIYSTLSSYMGGEYVNDFVKFGRVYQVNVAANSLSRSNISDITNLSVRNANGDMVPFSAFLTVEEVMGSPSIERYNMYETASVTGTPANDVSTSDGIKAMEEIVHNTLGNNYSYAWTGEAYQETQASTTISMVMLFAIIITLLVLAAQYENWTDPVAVIVSMPTAILGTVLGCLIMSQAISIYTQIGLILLLGLSAKNAILIVEYARDFRTSGLDIRTSAIDAGRIRFRPIMMTAMAFVFGVMPMLFATGAGAASRQSLGAAVVFGMFINAIIGTLFVPNFWELLERFRTRYLSGLFKTSDIVPGSAEPTPPATGNAADSAEQTSTDGKSNI